LKEVIEFYLAACSESIIGITCGVLESTADRLMSITEYSLVFCFYLISIYGLKQPAIFSDKSGTRFIATTQRLNNSKNANSIIDTQEQQVRKEGKYHKSSLTEELSTKVYQEISRFIHQQNLFLEPELSLSQLALESGFSKHHLSQAINQCANKTFFDFINCLRVDHAKFLLHDENKMNVLEISLASGFNSRSSFYNAFKKHTQLTPSQYKKQRTAKTCSA
tara:strand:- start:7518 stop:8180 length:663 start_codon:yes stop_codon:yes gene_type:complete